MSRKSKKIGKYSIIETGIVFACFSIMILRLMLQMKFIFAISVLFDDIWNLFILKQKN